MDTRDISYINSTEYKILEDRVKELGDVLDDLRDKSTASRKLRYADIDIEAERLAGRLQPDELYVGQHIIDTNIRREQSAYVQYLTQSMRAVICEDSDDDSVDLALLEKDLTKKIRFKGWQLSQFANVDSFQANGYGIMEVVYDESTPGGVGHEAVQYGDFAFIMDTRDIQQVEMTSRSYYYNKTRLIQLCGDGSDPSKHWNRTEVDKIISAEPSTTNTAWDDEYSTNKKSLYRVQKLMFRVNGTVHVAWCCPTICSDWLRIPRPLFLGRRSAPVQAQTNPLLPTQQPQMAQGQQPQSEPVFETNYPYILFPYLISENDTISHLKGRVYLDQDIQEAVSSLISSTCTQARRAAGLYFAKDSDDPNDDVLMQKNIFFKSGALINSKVKAFPLSAPDSSIFSAIQLLQSNNQNETSQVNFAVANRKDSRKTAKEVEVASQQAQILSTVQVVLFSIALNELYTLMTDIIKSRVLAGIIQVNPLIAPLYARNFTVKPAGDVDVIEKQQLTQTMQQSWPVMQNTPAAIPFLSDLIELLFPINAPKYLKAFMQAQQQQQSQQAQQQQQVMGMLIKFANGIVNLDEHKEYFSDSGLLHAYPVIQDTSREIKKMEKQLGAGGAHQNGQQKQLAA